MFLIGNAVIDDPVAEAKFCCDVESCRGACCTLEGLRGAPLEDAEVAEVKRALPAIRPYLSPESLREIEAIGPVDGVPGEYATPCIGNRECVYVSFVGAIATCSFERAFLDGAITWRKPISCHLFPIRIRGFGQEYLRYEVIDECAAGRSRGEREGIPLRDFLEAPLTRKFGPDWYRTFAEECRRQNGHRPADEPAIE